MSTCIDCHFLCMNDKDGEKHSLTKQERESIKESFYSLDYYNYGCYLGSWNGSPFENNSIEPRAIQLIRYHNYIIKHEKIICFRLYHKGMTLEAAVTFQKLESENEKAAGDRQQAMKSFNVAKWALIASAVLGLFNLGIGIYNSMNPLSVKVISVPAAVVSTSPTIKPTPSVSTVTTIKKNS